MKPMHHRLALLALVAGCGGLLGGCNDLPRRDPDYAASMPAVRPPPAQAANGAIYQAGYNLVLFEDVRARRIGDTLTIKLVEKTDASKSAESSMSKSQTTTIDNPTIFGASPTITLPGALPFPANTTHTLATNLSSSHEFSGSGDNTQKNSLTGDITVTVADVLPNGNLVVRGEKRLNLNQGNEYVKISGIVRPIDIAADNTIPSTKVADATIVYNGDGQTAAANKLAWLARFFISAIFPF
jgi:flagellar L-ring protein precursor FlgH